MDSSDTRGRGNELEFNGMSATDDVSRQYAQTYGSPGELARFSGFLRAVWPLLLLAILAGYLLRALFFDWPSLSQVQVGICFIVLAGAGGFLLGKCSTRFAAFIKGARGEERVASVLAFLPSGYSVFNGLAIDGRLMPKGVDFDHIVVGPSGIFVVETKNWSSKVVYAGGKLLYEGGKEPQRPPLDQARVGASRLKAEIAKRLDLELPVRSVVCFAGGNFVDVRREMQDATICNLSDLISVICQVRGAAMKVSKQNCAAVAELLQGWMALEPDPSEQTEQQKSEGSEGRDCEDAVTSAPDSSL